VIEWIFKIILSVREMRPVASFCIIPSRTGLKTFSSNRIKPLLDFRFKDAIEKSPVNIYY